MMIMPQLCSDVSCLHSRSVCMLCASYLYSYFYFDRHVIGVPLVVLWEIFEVTVQEGANSLCFEQGP